MSAAAVEAVFWDVGNVILRWDARLLCDTLFDDPADVDAFLALWSPYNLRCDGGEPFADVLADAVAAHPQHRGPILAMHERWIETVPGPVDGMLELLDEVAATGVAQYALTNFSDETFPLVTHHPHFERFDDVVVSGRLGVCKPDPAIFMAALDVAGVAADRTLFFDDAAYNVDGARAVGMRAERFVDAAQARRDLISAGVLGAS